MKFEKILTDGERILKQLSLKKAAHIALEQYMGLSDEETLLVISDYKTRDIGLALFEAGLNIADEAYYMEMMPRSVNGEEPPDVIARMMKEVDVVICPTIKSLTHTNARREASRLGVRIGTMPGITEDTMIRCLNADAYRIVELSNKVNRALADATEIRVETLLGTNLTIPVKGRKIFSSTGVIRNIGESGNLPSGEVYLSPWEGKTYGKVVFDASFSEIGMLDNPITIEIDKGYAEKISGKTEARELSRILNKVGNEARQVAEFGIGTNYQARICGDILEDEKVLGTIHVAFGNNVSMGGIISVPLHLDGIVLNPTVYVDGEMIIDNGNLLIK
ncbi:MAG: aminopeptidase [Candidatus Kapabacteria bacterium]|nr:aminopeptidase [Candidatus Kapabacteria bacterium]